jgi:membrane protein
MNNDPPARAETFQDRRNREREEQYEAKPQANAEERGRNADAPSKIPARGWFDVMKRSIKQIEGDHLPLISAGVAFFFLFGLFPGLAAIISIYGWLADPATIAGHIDQLSTVLPAQAAEIIHNQAEQLAGAETAAGWGAIIGVALALWAGSKAMRGMVEALNIAYNQRESRGFFKKQVIYLTLTLGAVLVGLSSILLIAIAPAIVNFLPLPDWGRQTLMWLRWPVLLLFGMTGIAAIYRYGPAREKAKWRWVSWGAGGATVLWLIVSALFSLYVSSFGNFNEIYGSLGAVIVLMMWLYLTAFLILMGAEVDAELELQTQQDTTSGKESPMGERGAFAADHAARHP